MGYQTRPDIRPLHNRILVGDCVIGTEEDSGGLRRSRLRRSALQSAARGQPHASRPEQGRRRRRCTGTSSPASRHYDRFTKALAVGMPPRAEARWRIVGDRLLSQHLPRRHHPAGSRLLDPQRRHLAQDQPDAEFPRPALHQRARNADLGGARSGVEIHLPLRSHEGLQRRPADALRLDPAALHRG